MAIKSKRVPVQVEQSTFEKVKEYSDLTGVAIAHVVNEAIATWMETVGAVRVEVLTSRANGKDLMTKATRPARWLPDQPTTGIDVFAGQRHLDDPADPGR